jgi:ferric-dicitrate binding protein FerR (iron transport regulator)
MQDWWLLYLAFVILAAQGEAHRRSLRSVEAKLGAALRRLGGDPGAVESELKRADEAAEAEQRGLARRSVPLGLVLMVAGGAAGALAGWWWGPAERAWAGGAIGALAGFVLGGFLHGLREGMRG